VPYVDLSDRKLPPIPLFQYDDRTDCFVPALLAHKGYIYIHTHLGELFN
jgi:hypothetical protein